MRRMPAGLIRLLLIAAIAPADARIVIPTADPAVALGISCSASVQAGQLVKYFYKNSALAHQWVREVYTQLTVDAVIHERTRISIGTEGNLWYNTFPKGLSTGQANSTFDKNYSVVISEAWGSYGLGDTAHPFLSIAGGLFPFKYNPDARNLGEYLFRSGTYPAYIITMFDFAYARLSGFRLSSDLFGILHQDMLLTMETDIHPFNDFTLSYIAEAGRGKAIDGALGVSLAHLFPVDNGVTTPRRPDNAFFTNVRVLKDVLGNDSIVQDTNYYTFTGTKLMGRLSFDPKAIFQLPALGPEDLKMYAEAAVLGVKEYPRNDSIDFSKNPYGYDSLLHKIPLMAGINLPAFKLLDVLSVEAEWYGCRYANNFTEVSGRGTRDGSPKPDAPREGADYTRDDWKWSMYARKTIGGHLGLVLQCARDHMRTRSVFEESRDREEALSKDDHWWWMLKFFAAF